MAFPIQILGQLEANWAGAQARAASGALSCVPQYLPRSRITRAQCAPVTPPTKYWHYWAGSSPSFLTGMPSGLHQGDRAGPERSRNGGEQAAKGTGQHYSLHPNAAPSPHASIREDTKRI